MAKSKEERLWEFLSRFFYKEIGLDEFDSKVEARRVFNYVTKYYKTK